MLNRMIGLELNSSPTAHQQALLTVLLCSL